MAGCIQGLQFTDHQPSWRFSTGSFFFWAFSLPLFLFSHRSPREICRDNLGGMPSPQVVPYVMEPVTSTSPARALSEIYGVIFFRQKPPTRIFAMAKLLATSTTISILKGGKLGETVATKNLVSGWFGSKMFSVFIRFTCSHPGKPFRSPYPASLQSEQLWRDAKELWWWMGCLVSETCNQSGWF